MSERASGGIRLGACYIDPGTGRATGPAGAAQLSPAAVAALMCLASRPRSTIDPDALADAIRVDPARLAEVIAELNDVIRDERGGRLIEPSEAGGFRLLALPEHAEGAGARPAAAGLLEELRRRGVIETGLAYLVVGWLLLQVSDATFEQLLLPPWAGTFLAYLVIIGFPIAIALAWFLELKPRGLALDGDRSPKPPRALAKPYVAIAAALVIASVSVYLFDRYIGLISDRTSGAAAGVGVSAATIDPNSIAVLPFLNISTTDDGQIFANGLAEDVINRLARVPGLLVSSRGDSFSMAPNSPSQDVRARLRVAYYIEGSVRETSDMLRIVVQLIDSASGFHLVSRSFDRPRSDFFRIQDEITSLAVANMRVALPESTRREPLASDGPNLDAYLLYRAGMEALYGPRTRESIDSALEAFRQALNVDAEYAAAHAGLCMTYVSAYLLNAEDIDAAEQSCAAALAFNSNLDVVHNALGQLYLRTGRYEDAEVAFERALAINSKSVDSMIGLGRVYMNQQRSTETEEIYAQAIGLQPGNWEAYNALGGFLYLTGRYQEGAAQYREVVAIDAENITGWSNLGSALLLSGGFTEAASAFERANAIRPTPTAYANLGLLHYYLGEREAAADALRAATDLAPNDYLVWSNLGDVLSFSPDPRQAQQAFRRAETLAEAQLRINRRDSQMTANLAWIKAMLGERDEAQRLIASVRSEVAEDPYTPYIEALILVKHGDLTAALDSLATAVRLGYPRALIAAEPHLAPLRNAELFEELVGD